MKKYLSLLALAAFLAGLTSLLIFMEVRAVDDFIFFIPYPADVLDEQFDVANDEETPNPFCTDYIDGDIVTTISIATRNGSVIFYDHWEDGLEVNLTSPTQATTEIWGDNNPRNGIPPGFPTDVLGSETVIVLQNTVSLPRNPADPLFDGGDKLTSVGGNLAVTLAVWPTCSRTLFAGAWELYPTSRWGRLYLIPIGQDLAPSDPSPGPKRGGFGTVGLNVQAAEDDTTVQLDLDADGSFETTLILNQGQQFSQVSGVRSGAEIRASGPVQVHVFTGDPTWVPDAYEARAYTIVPREQWTGDYIAPRSSDGNYWLFNPNSSPLTVTVETSTTVTSLLIPANRVRRYPNPPPSALSPATGVRFTSTDGRPFYGVAALDPNFRRDWGYALLPINNLTSQVLVGWAPGDASNPPLNSDSRIYVTAASATTLSVDFDNDGTVDRTIPIAPLAQVPVIDPDNDLTGAFLFTTDGTLFVAVWGQDPTAPSIGNAIDVGTSLIPLPTLPVQKTVKLINDADGSGTLTWGDTIEFTLFTVNNLVNDINDVTLEDTLPATVTYIPNTSTVRGSPVPDDGSGATLFPFDEGGYSLGTLSLSAVVTATFEVLVNANVDFIVNTATVDSPITPPAQGGISVPVNVARYELNKRLIDPASGIADTGQVITFGLTITSTGNISITKLPLRDTFNEDHLTFLRANPPPDFTAAGVISWTDLAALTLFGPLPPGRTIDLTVSFIVDPIPPGVTNTINFARIEGAQGSDGSSPPPVEATDVVDFPGPISSATPTPTATKSPDDDDDGGPPPATPVGNIPPGGTSPPVGSPQASPPANGSVTPALTPGAGLPPNGPGIAATGTALPVNLLPETGLRSAVGVNVWYLAGVLVFGLLVWWKTRVGR